MKTKIHNGYEHFLIEKYIDHYNRVKKEINKENCGFAGKYLLFSYSREILKKEAISLCEKFELGYFKISMENQDNGIFSYVCQIYDFKKRYAGEMSNLIDPKYIAYRFWKPEILSRRKIYSNEYLNHLNNKS